MVNSAAAKSSSRWLVGELVEYCSEKACEWRRKPGTHIKYVFVCVLESETVREKAKIRNGTKRGKQKVGERCQFRTWWERCNNCPCA